ncbi:MAG: hypothetical protein IKJ33_05215 [Clostridia bacterium]|nr:hypothetical protein [Clostridia bacterium]
MDNASKEEKVDWVKGVKIALKTLVACFVVIMFSLTFIFVLFPKFSLKINNTLGLDKVKELNYQMIYKRTDKITDLYNVILFEAELGKTSKELEYIDEIIKRDDYVDFCKTMDKVSFESSKDKQMIPYLVNVNGYLTSRKIVCLYELDINGIETYVYRQTATGKFAEYSFATYVDLVCDDETLTDAQKREKLSFIINIVDTSGKTHKELLNKRIDDINNRLNIEDSEEGKISLQYALTRIYRARYCVYETLGNEAEMLSNKTAYETAKTKLNEMIN